MQRLRSRNVDRPRPVCRTSQPGLSAPARREHPRRRAGLACSSWQSSGRCTAGLESAAALGFIGLIQFLPVLVLAIPAGHLADRMSRKWQFVFAQVLMFCASAGLATVSYSEGPVLYVYVCLFMVGVGRAFAAPARWSLLPQVVPPEALANAVTWNSTGWQVATTVGPAIGGFADLGRLSHASGVYVLAAISYRHLHDSRRDTSSPAG